MSFSNGLSCLLFSRFCDVASLFVVCELPWRFGFWFPALLCSLSLLLSPANESIACKKSKSFVILRKSTSFDFLRSGVCAKGRVRVLVGRRGGLVWGVGFFVDLVGCFFTFV
jgi:hypothetical protein